MKLSKLSILRIASKYIQYLSALLGMDCGGQGHNIDICRTILIDTIENETCTKR